MVVELATIVTVVCGVIMLSSGTSWFTIGAAVATLVVYGVS